MSDDQADGELEPGPQLGGLVNADGLLARAHRYDYGGLCWWCGQVANSGEHKSKRTDLVRAYGAGPWKGESAVTHIVDGGGQRDLQSPGAARVKFTKVLCSDCNSARSQPFDLAYEQFADYFVSAQEGIWAAGEFCWSDIFDSEWRAGRNLVTAYWLKHIGCRFADGGVLVDVGIIDSLNHPGRTEKVPLRLEIQACDDVEAFTRHLRHHKQMSSTETFHIMQMSGLFCLYSRSRGAVRQATGSWGIGWLRLTYQFDFNYPELATNFWENRVRLAHVSDTDPASLIDECQLCQ
jgi:hypothetical protein